MKYIATILLLGVFVRHHTSYWISEATGYSPQGVFYILGGLWEVALSSLLLVVVLSAAQSIWRRLAVVALVICILEATQVSVCRIAVKNVSVVPKGTNLCDYVTGLPIGAAMIATYLIIICYGILRKP